MSDFKPCPFCGGTDIRAESHSAHRSSTAVVWSMCCYTCGATFPNRYRREVLVAAWNRRQGNGQRAKLERLNIVLQDVIRELEDDNADST